MASAVGTLQGVKFATPLPSTSSPVQLGNLRPSSFATSLQNRGVGVHVPPAASASANELCMSTNGTGAVQCLRNTDVPASVIFATHRGLAGVTRESGRARHVRVYAADGPQTAAEPSATIDVVRQVIAEQLDVKIDELDPSTKFGDLGADSLDTVEIMMGLEDRCGVAFEDDGAESIATVQDAADLIDAIKKKKK